MWCARYWPGTYWTARYWCKVGEDQDLSAFTGQSGLVGRRNNNVGLRTGV